MWSVESGSVEPRENIWETGKAEGPGRKKTASEGAEWRRRLREAAGVWATARRGYTARFPVTALGEATAYRLPLVLAPP